MELCSAYKLLFERVSIKWAEADHSRLIRLPLDEVRHQDVVDVAAQAEFGCFIIIVPAVLVVHLPRVCAPLFKCIFVGPHKLLDFIYWQVELRYNHRPPSSQFEHINDSFLVWHATHNFGEEHEAQGQLEEHGCLDVSISVQDQVLLEQEFQLAASWIKQ